MGSGASGADAWVLVLDVGSSSIRAWFYGGDGDGIDPGPDAQRRYRWRTTAEGAMECDAEVLFGYLGEVLDGALAHARAARAEVQAVAMASLWHSLVGLAADGTPVTPVYAWGDNRAADQAVRLRDRVDEEALHQRTGCFLHPSYPTVKLAWLRDEAPEAFARVTAWPSLPEYLEWRLFGEQRCSVSMASGSGLLDVHRLRWDPEAVEMAGIREGQLFPLVDVDAPAPRLRAPLAARWPELARVPWFPALGDGACANVGSGAVGIDRLGVTVGTTAAVRALWEPIRPVRVPEDLWAYRLDGRRWVVGGALSNGGNAVAYLRRALQLPGEREWEAAIAAMDPDSHGLVVLPFLVGERGMGWLQQGRAALIGLTQTTRPEQILRAWMEAVALRVGLICARLQSELQVGGEVLASGGALHASPVWTQILADAMGSPVTLSVEREATARGAALVALEQLGVIADLRDTRLRTAARFEPDAARHARYRAAMHRQQEISRALAPWLRADEEIRSAR